MTRISVSRLVLATMAIAVIGKASEMLTEGQIARTERSGVPSLTFFSPAQAASEPPKADATKTAEALIAGEAACVPSETIYVEIQRERKLLDEQRQALIEREAKLQIGQQALESEAEKLLGFKAALEDLLAKVESAQNDDVNRLVNLYRNMKPKEAAGIINELDIESTVMILATMAERDAAPILANIDAARARAISKILIERSKLPGDQDFSGIRLR